jgi:hypothetical protein
MPNLAAADSITAYHHTSPLNCYYCDVCAAFAQRLLHVYHNPHGSFTCALEKMRNTDLHGTGTLIDDTI